MESLHPDAQTYLEAIRKAYTSSFGDRQWLDKWHGTWRAYSNDPLKSPEARSLYADKARAVEIRLRELELQDLLEGKTIQLLTGE